MIVFHICELCMKLHGGSAVINISIKTVVDIKMGLSLDVETRFHAPYNEENEKLCGFMCVCGCACVKAYH